MEKKSVIPASAITIRTYAELKTWIRAIQGRQVQLPYDFVQPGLAKAPCCAKLVGREDDPRKPELENK